MPRGFVPDFERSATRLALTSRLLEGGSTLLPTFNLVTPHRPGAMAESHAIADVRPHRKSGGADDDKAVKSNFSELQ